MKKRTGFWKERILNIRDSFRRGGFREWVKYGAMDLGFILLVSVLLLVFLASSVIQLEKLEAAVDRLSPLVNPPADGQEAKNLQLRMESVEDSINSGFVGFFVVVLLNVLAFMILVGSWGYVGLSSVLNIRRSFLGWARFVALFAVWSVLCLLLFGFSLFVVDDVYALLVLVLFWLLVFVYFSVLVTYYLLKKSNIRTLNRFFRVASAGQGKLIFGFVVCLLVFLVFNMLFLVFDVPFSLLGALLSLLFYVLFLSWSRIYLCIELEGVFADVRL